MHSKGKWISENRRRKIQNKIKLDSIGNFGIFNEWSFENSKFNQNCSVVVQNQFLNGHYYRVDEVRFLTFHMSVDQMISNHMTVLSVKICCIFVESNIEASTH